MRSEIFFAIEPLVRLRMKKTLGSYVVMMAGVWNWLRTVSNGGIKMKRQ
jgi:hypothetical protein